MFSKNLFKFPYVSLLEKDFKKGVDLSTRNAYESLHKNLKIKPQLPFSQHGKTIIQDTKVSKRYIFAFKAGLLVYHSCPYDFKQVKSWAYKKFLHHDLISLIVSKVKYNSKMYSQHSSRAKSEYVFLIYFKLGRRLFTCNAKFFDLPSIASELPYHPVITSKLSNKGNLGISRCNDYDHAETVQSLLEDHVGWLEDETRVYVSDNIKKRLLVYNIGPYIDWITARRKKTALESLWHKNPRYPLKIVRLFGSIQNRAYLRIMIVT